jgi:hypothetical protein
MKYVDITESVVAESVVVIKKLLQMQVSLKSFFQYTKSVWLLLHNFFCELR